MARKSALTQEGLAALGPEKLAAIILAETDGNPAFRRRVNAALAAAKGPEAVAKIIDVRLAALERARGDVYDEKARELADDLNATVKSITGELAPLDPRLAIDTLFRFIDTEGIVVQRTDDPGRMELVYHHAGEAILDLIARLPPESREFLPDRIMRSLAQNQYGVADNIANALPPLLSAGALAAWDKKLAASRTANDEKIPIRQAIAEARGDLDTYMALENKRPELNRDPTRVAEKLLKANRLDEALDWVKRKHKVGLSYATAASMAEGRSHSADDVVRTVLEAKILDAKGNRAAAQAVRWSGFEATLHPSILREYLRKLEDFVEYEEQERAFALVAASPHSYTALEFFIEWPRPDRAAALVMERRAVWDGRHYMALAPAAEALEEKFPLAASVLYRALLTDILAFSRSQAYNHGAKYLVKLEALSGLIETWGDLPTHDQFKTALTRTHGRKSAFWQAVETKPPNRRHRA
jgi:hypothetical protein